MKKTIVPNVKNPGDNTGLVLRDGLYSVRYTESGRRKVQSTGTRNIADARHFRDKLYAKLLAAGATRATRQKFDNARRAEKVKQDPDCYIFQRKPFAVIIDKNIVAECSTRREAREARDKFLGVS